MKIFERLRGKRIIVEFLIAFIISLAIDTGNFVLDILAIAIILILLECIYKLIDKKVKKWKI